MSASRLKGFFICSIYGAGSCAEWAAEGRRLVPLMPRLVPQTVFSASATAAANSAAATNAKVPVSSGTCQKSYFQLAFVILLLSLSVMIDPWMHLCTHPQLCFLAFEHEKSLRITTMTC